MAVRDFLRIEAEKRGDAIFEVELDDGRVAVCWRACKQPYSDMEISAGLVDELPPEDVYLRLERDGDEEPTYLFMRRDEALAVLNVLSGALWSREVLGHEEG